MDAHHHIGLIRQRDLFLEGDLGVVAAFGRSGSCLVETAYQQVLSCKGAALTTGYKGSVLGEIGSE